MAATIAKPHKPRTLGGTNTRNICVSKLRMIHKEELILHIHNHYIVICQGLASVVSPSNTRATQGIPMSYQQHRNFREGMYSCVRGFEIYNQPCSRWLHVKIQVRLLQIHHNLDDPHTSAILIHTCSMYSFMFGAFFVQNREIQMQCDVLSKRLAETENALRKAVRSVSDKVRISSCICVIMVYKV